MSAQMLEPCPFCGGSATMEQTEDNRWSVGCDSADEPACMGYQSLTTFGRQGEATAAWNKRARSSAGSDGPIGYVSAITLKALSDRAEGHGFVVACAGYDTTIPVYAHPAPPAAASVSEAIEAEIEKWSTDKRSSYPAVEVAESFVRILAANSEPAPAAPKREEIIEECAKVADDLYDDAPDGCGWDGGGETVGWHGACSTIASKLREMKSKQSQAESDK